MAPWRKEDYLAYFEASRLAAGLSRTRFGYEAVGDPNFIPRLEDPARSVRMSTLEKALAFVERMKTESKAGDDEDEQKGGSGA